MAALSNIRGLLLEEVLLHLLETTGYKTVEQVGNDPTLEVGPAGLKVKGRGCSHQIDAIADFRVSHPFSHPQRLLVEAKCFRPRERVGIDIARAAVGTLKDVGEHWVSSRGAIPKERYHYRYALFSATGYTSETQRYAFAQDIYLIPLGESAFFLPVIEAIRRIGPRVQSDERNPNVNLSMKLLRSVVRRRLRNPNMASQIGLEGIEQVVDGLERFFSASRGIRFALLAVLGKQFPVFLVPGPQVSVAGRIDDEYHVRITRGEADERWILRNRDDGRELFSFDLPRELFIRYANQGMLSAEAALDLKQSEMRRFHAFYVRNDDVRLARFRLDEDWIASLRDRLHGKRDR